MSKMDDFLNQHHPSKLYKRLNKEEITMLNKFILDNAFLSANEFEYKANRLFLDQPNKPKNHMIITELLSMYNSFRRSL